MSTAPTVSGRGGDPTASEKDNSHPDVTAATAPLSVPEPADMADTDHQQAQELLYRLDALGVPLFVARPGGGEFTRPTGWQNLDPATNFDRLERWREGDAVCAVGCDTLAWIDVDPRNGGDTEQVRGLLDRLGVRIYHEHTTPGGGVHFGVPGHPDLPTVKKLPSWPGVEIQSHAANVYLPGTLRPKYNGAGYRIVFCNLEALADGGDTDSAEALLNFVVSQQVRKDRDTTTTAPAWPGGTPDTRQQAYLDKTLQAVAAEVADCPGAKECEHGGRNKHLNTAAWRLGKFVAGAGLDEQTVRAALTQACDQNGLTADDGQKSVQASLNSGLTAGKLQPKRVPDAAVEVTEVSSLDDGTPPPVSDGGRNRTRFIDPHHGLLADDLRAAVAETLPCGANHTDGRLYAYRNGVWQPNTGQIETVIAAHLGNQYRQSHARNVAELIRYHPDTTPIDCSPAADWINTTSGMLHWRTGKLHEHHPDYRSTVQLPVEYRPDAACPEFDAYLKSTLPEDCWTPNGDSRGGFIWELIGYMMYSGNPLHVAVLLYGSGRNGKGAFIRVLKQLLGERNCSTATLHELAENRFRAATLYGKIANLAGDIDSRWLQTTATFKAITGGDSIQAEYKYGAAFDFAPWAVPLYSANRPFGSADSSEGWMARWLVLPFPNSFLGREDRTLDARLSTPGELAGILARGAAALPDLMARGRFAEPPSVTEAKRLFVAASDAVRGWLDEHCALNSDAWTPRTHLYSAFVSNADADGGARLSAREFYTRLGQINGLRPLKKGGERGYVGVGLAVREPAGAPFGAFGAGRAGSLTPDRPRGGKGRKPALPAPDAPDGPDDAKPVDNSVQEKCRSDVAVPGVPGFLEPFPESAHMGEVSQTPAHPAHPGAVTVCTWCELPAPAGRGMHFDCERLAAASKCDGGLL